MASLPEKMKLEFDVGVDQGHGLMAVTIQAMIVTDPDGRILSSPAFDSAKELEDSVQRRIAGRAKTVASNLPYHLGPGTPSVALVDGIMEEPSPISGTGYTIETLVITAIAPA